MVRKFMTFFASLIYWFLSRIYSSESFFPAIVSDEPIEEYIKGKGNIRCKFFRPCSVSGKIIVSVEFLAYFLTRIVPRILVCAFISWSLKEGGLITALGTDGEPLFKRGLLTNDGAFVAFILLLFYVFKKFPPSVEKLYLIQPTNSADEYRQINEELEKVSKLCENKYGIYFFDKSFLIRGKCALEVNRLYYELTKTHDLSNYDKVWVKYER